MKNKIKIVFFIEKNSVLSGLSVSALWVFALVLGWATPLLVWADERPEYNNPKAPYREFYSDAMSCWNHFSQKKADAGGLDAPLVIPAQGNYVCRKAVKVKGRDSSVASQCSEYGFYVLKQNINRSGEFGVEFIQVRTGDRIPSETHDGLPLQAGLLSSPGLVSGFLPIEYETRDASGHFVSKRLFLSAEAEVIRGADSVFFKDNFKVVAVSSSEERVFGSQIARDANGNEKHYFRVADHSQLGSPIVVESPRAASASKRGMDFFMCRALFQHADIEKGMTLKAREIEKSCSNEMRQNYSSIANITRDSLEKGAAHCDQKFAAAAEEYQNALNSCQRMNEQVCNRGDFAFSGVAVDRFRGSVDQGSANKKARAYFNRKASYVVKPSAKSQAFLSNDQFSIEFRTPVEKALAPAEKDPEFPVNVRFRSGTVE